MEEKEIQSTDDETIELVDDTPEEGTGVSQESPATTPEGDAALQELNNKYLRLYAEFENYRKRINREKEDLVKYGNESLLYELLPAIDHLELALKHAACDAGTGLLQGVTMTLKELQRSLEKFGLTRIESAGKPFDPAVHHAMMQVEREDLAEKMVAEELRAGYKYRDKVLRPALVSVSIKPQKDAAKAAETKS